MRASGWRAVVFSKIPPGNPDALAHQLLVGGLHRTSLRTSMHRRSKRDTRRVGSTQNHATRSQRLWTAKQHLYTHKCFEELEQECCWFVATIAFWGTHYYSICKTKWRIRKAMLPDPFSALDSETLFRIFLDTEVLLMALSLVLRNVPEILFLTDLLF